MCSAHNAFVCFVCISEQTAIITLYNTNLSVFKTEAECLLRGTDWVFKLDRVNDNITIYILVRKETESQYHTRPVATRLLGQSLIFRSPIQTNTLNENFCKSNMKNERMVKTRIKDTALIR